MEASTRRSSRMKSPELDHLGFACRDLEPLLKTFFSLGFAPTQAERLQGVDRRGRPFSLGQISAHVVLGNTYIELSAVPDPTTGNHLEPFLARHEGLHILALRAEDIAAAHRRARDAQKNPSRLQNATRQINYGDQQGSARFRWWMLPASDMPSALLCYVDNQKPELVYQAAVQEHPNGALDVSAVLIRAADPAQSIQHWLPITTNSAPHEKNCIELPNAQLRFSRYENLDLPQAPCLAGLEVTVQICSLSRNWSWMQAGKYSNKLRLHWACI